MTSSSSGETSPLPLREGGVNRSSAAYRWNILALLASSQAIAYIDRVNFAVVGPQLIKVYHYTPGQVGLLQSIFSWAYTLSLLAAGPLTDRIWPRRSYPLGVGTWSLATALCSLTKAFAPLAGFLALLGIGESLMIPSGARVIRETFDKKNRALAVGTFFAGNKIGLTIGIPFASVVLVNWGWEWVFYTTGSLGLFWILWWGAVYRAPAREDAPATPERNPKPNPLGELAPISHHLGRDARPGRLSLYLLCLCDLAAGLSRPAAGDVGADHRLGRHVAVPHRNHLRDPRRLAGRSADRRRASRDPGAQRFRRRRPVRRDASSPSPAPTRRTMSWRSPSSRFRWRASASRRRR